jgi:hypothetical protein
LPYDNLGIGSGNVSPLQRDGANRAVVDAQQKPLAVPVVPFANAGERSAAEWMEGMNYADKLRRCDGKARVPG